LDDTEGCFYSGQFLSGTDPNIRPHVTPDINKSLKDLEKGCELTKNGLLAAECCFAASSLYLFGRNGCTKDMKKAFELSLKGCNLDHIYSCGNLSQMYLYGEGTQQDIQLGNKYRKKTIEMQEQINKFRPIDTQRS
jgi:TPR repeat protein